MLPAPPPRYKQATVIWLAFFPLSLLASWVLGHVAPDLPLLARVLVTTLSLTPVMTYVVLPRMTAALGWWLQGRPAPWRRAVGRPRRPGRPSRPGPPGPGPRLRP